MAMSASCLMILVYMYLQNFYLQVAWCMLRSLCNDRCFLKDVEFLVFGMKQNEQLRLHDLSLHCYNLYVLDAHSIAYDSLSNNQLLQVVWWEGLL